MSSAVGEKTALVTGASGGIGAAVAVALAGEVGRLVLSGRDAGRLEEVAGRVRERGAAEVEVFAADLADEAALRALSWRAGEHLGGLDVLVHSIGLFRGGTPSAASVADLDDHLRVNLRVPYLLTQLLLPWLLPRQGQIVFVNSSAGFHPARAHFAAYAASKHALRAYADALREEVNKQGVRVLTVYPGRTASAMQQEVHRYEGKDYDPARFLQPDDVASAVLSALNLARTAELTDLHIRPMRG
jgi:short-subunit dehydrogenase